MDTPAWIESAARYGLLPRDPVIRNAARASALECMWFADVLRGARAQAKRVPRVQFIYLHHVFPDEESRFRAHIGALRDQFTLVPYSEAVRRCFDGAIDRPYACISFDDGLLNHLAAARLLREMGVSACFFVCPGVVGETRFEVINDWSLNRLHRPPARVLSWDDVGTMCSLGHEIGSHTHRHTDMGALPEQEAADELGHAREELVRRLGPQSGRHFAWPYGRMVNMTARNARAVFQVGYASCASAVRGAHAIEARGVARPFLRRDLLICGWSRRVMSALLTRNARSLTPGSVAWPQGWSEVMDAPA